MIGSSPDSFFWKEAGQAGFKTVCALDFEGSARTGVVEYGWVAFGSEGILESGTALCRPQRPVSWKETETHGLRSEDLGDTVPFSDFWTEFRDLRRRSPFLAHSAAVEDRFLRRQWPTAGDVPDWSAMPSRVFGWGPWLDSCSLVRTVISGGSASLRSVVEGWGLLDDLETLAVAHCPERRRGWHAALFDSLASALIFQRVLEARPGWGIRRVFAESRSKGGEGEQEELF